MKVLIDKDAFGELILDLISTQEYKQYTDIMLTTDKKAFESGFIQGMCWSYINAIKLQSYFYTEERINKGANE